MGIGVGTSLATATAPRHRTECPSDKKYLRPSPSSSHTHDHIRRLRLFHLSALTSCQLPARRRNQQNEGRRPCSDCGPDGTAGDGLFAGATLPSGPRKTNPRRSRLESPLGGGAIPLRANDQVPAPRPGTSSAQEKIFGHRTSGLHRSERRRRSDQQVEREDDD